MSINASNVTLSFTTDPKVREIIQAFMCLDQHWSQYSSILCDRDEMTRFTNTLKQLRCFLENKYVSIPFKTAIRAEMERLQRQCIASGKLPRTKKSNRQAHEWYKTIDPNARTTKLAFLIMEEFGIDYIIPNGRRTDWLLNCLIVTLVEYGKCNFSRTQWYSVLATKFNASTFRMSGWKHNKTKARKQIEDRYSWMKRKIDVKEIVEKILKCFTTSE